MSSILSKPPTKPVIYPESDGQPMAENTRQWEWINRIKNGLEIVFRDRDDVFVAGDLFWYPVEGDPLTAMAPDILVAIGRPKGDRGSYRQWEEGGIAPQAVFEILSPRNTFAEMMRKFKFYQQYGAEEYYIFDPDPAKLELTGYLRNGPSLVEIPRMQGFVSPRLGIRFEMGDDLQIFGPDGKPFITAVDWANQNDAQAAELVMKRKQLTAKDDEIARLRAELAKHEKPGPNGG